LNTHFDLAFPYFLSSDWEVMPINSFYFYNDYYLFLNFDNSNFVNDINKIFVENSLKRKFLWHDYNLLCFNWLFIFFFNVSFYIFYFGFCLYFLFWVFYFGFFIYFNIYKKVLKFFFLKFLKFL
jgi:hypothetical protein